MHSRSGWLWRYDLAKADVGSTEITLTYDWSGVTESAHEVLTFPPFPPDHLSNSVAHLEEVVRSAGQLKKGE